MLPGVEYLGLVALQAEGIAAGLQFQAVRIVTVRALDPVLEHDAVRERVALNAVFVSGSVTPELGRFFAWNRLESAESSRSDAVDLDGVEPSARRSG